jgi:hypothetical protein
MNTRRQFLVTASMGVVGSAAACRGQQSAPAGTPPPATAGTPPTFGTGPVSGPPVSPATFAEAEKLVQVSMSAAERDMAAASWRRSMAPLLERRTGPRKVALAPELAPAALWNPAIEGAGGGPAHDLFVRTSGGSEPLPTPTSRSRRSRSCRDGSSARRSRRSASRRST